MDRLNSILEKYFNDVGYGFSDDYNSVKKMSEIILSIREPRFNDKIKNRVGINRCIQFSHEFFDSFDFRYGDYFLKRLSQGGYDFKRVEHNSSEIPCSYYDFELCEKKIYLPYENTICDAFSIVHETLHDTNLDPNNLTLTRSLFTEYISMFGEFLFENFLVDNYDIKCKLSNNYSFNACYIKALKVDFQLSLIKCYLDKGSINDFDFYSILCHYDKDYRRYLYCIYLSIINSNDLNFDYEMRYLFGILLSCYSYDRFLNNDFDLDLFKFINESINYLEADAVYSYLDLDLINYDDLMLSNDSYDALSKSYVKIMNNR